MKYTPRIPRTNPNVSPTSSLREFFILGGGLLAALIGGYMVLGLAVDWVVPHVSHDLEKRWGSLLVGLIRTEDTASSPRRCLQSLVDDLQKGCIRLPYRFRVHLSLVKDANALALPGGNIVVFSGLLREVASENELAFVLAHELGHYAHRDHLRGLGRGVVLMAMSTLLFGSDSSMTRWFAQGLRITELRFSRRQEMRADAFALETLHCHYGQVAGYADFLKRLQDRKDPGRYGQYFATHPRTKHRIAHLRSIAESRRWRELEKRALPKTCRPEQSRIHPPPCDFNRPDPETRPSPGLSKAGIR